LYVAVSRATARKSIKVLSLPPNAEAEEEEARRQEQKNAKKNAKGMGKKMMCSKSKKEYYQ
jgi:ATP-dependent DNA helicase PIF1